VLYLGLKDKDKGRLSFIDPPYSIFADGLFKTVGGRAAQEADGRPQ